MWGSTMANEVVQYPSYSQKAAYPVSHKPVAAANAIEPEAVEIVDVVEVVEVPEVAATEAAVPAQIEPASVSQQQVPKFFPLVPVAVESVSEEDAVTEAPAQTEAAQTEVVVPEAEVQQKPDAEVEQEQAVELSPFQISGSLVLEPQTNSIVITQIPDALLAGSIVTETGEILTTGAIEIIAPPATGEIEVIPDSPDADSADAIDSATEYVSSVAPIRSSGVMNSKAKIGVLPGKLRKSMEHVVLATTLAVSIITISSLLALAYMFGILR